MADIATGLPAYLKTNHPPRVSERSTEGMGLPQPPHISIRGNEFTLVDSAGQARTVETKHLDVCITDVSDKMCKLYYGKDYTPDATDPPLCFSANGIAPSKDAINPQSPTCMQCPNNVRGSAVSKLTGAPIKACRDEKWLAVLVPGVDIGFQFRVTPGSFKNWRDYAEKFKGQQFDVVDVLTRMQFAKDSNGVVTFQPVSFIDEAMAGRRNQAIAAHVTDVLVGRTDEPISTLLPPGSVMAQPPALPSPQGTSASATPAAAVTPPATRAPGRPRKQAAAPAAAAEAPAPAPVAPFRPEPPPVFTGGGGAPAAAPFGVQNNPPAPPTDIKNEMDKFFNG